MDNTLTRIAVTRLGVLPAAPGPADPHTLAAFTAALARLGVRITNPDALTADAVASYPELEAIVATLRGATAVHAPLFDGFPDKLPSFDDAGWRFLLASVRLCHLHVDAIVEGHVLGDEAVREAMDFSSFGWWPASSVPSDVDALALARAHQELLDGDTHREWIDLTVMSPDDARSALSRFVTDCAYSPASLRTEVQADLATLVDGYDLVTLDLDRVTFNEVRALFTTAAFKRADAAALIAMGAAPDDLLRVFAALTDTDVSLASTVTFPKLSRPQRRVVLDVLEASPRRRDVFRRRGLWLALARSLHVGEYASSHPVASGLFAELRSSRRDSLSVLSRSEALVSAGDPVAAAKLLSLEAPTVLARQLRRLAFLAGAQTGELVSLFDAAASSVPLRVLFTLRAQLADNGVTYPRLAVSKAGAPLVIDHQPGHLALPDDVATALVASVDTAICARLSARPSWAHERVWVDETAAALGVPDQLRASTDGLLTLDRGSRLPLGDAKVLRLFVQWREPEGQTSDLDLSLMALDESFEVVDQVSWTNLANGEMTHSGDLTSAPEGAAEFIDVRLSAAKSRTSYDKVPWRYLAPAVYRYSGPSFGELDEAFAGWMLRDEPSSDRKTFDPATVVNAFALTGSRGTALPFVYDLHTGEVIYLDVYVSSFFAARVEESASSVSRIASALASRTAIRPHICDVVQAHVSARGAVLVDDRDDATVTVGLDDDCTFNVLRPQAFVTDLLSD
jgi:hypothetical protein